MKPPTYSAEFKQEVVEQLLSGGVTAAQVCRQHRIDDSTVRRWRREYADRGLSAWTATVDSGSQERRIAALERMIGQLTMENTLLKKAAALRTRSRSESGSVLGVR